MKCGQYFTSMIEIEESTPSEVVVVHFYPEVLKKVFIDDFPHLFSAKTNAAFLSKSINRVAVDKVLKNYIDSLLFFFENPSLVTEDLVSLKLKEIILLLLNTNSKEAEKIKLILSDLFNPTQASMKEIVEHHLYNNLTIEQLASLCSLSLSTFKRRFVELFEDTPAAYIRKKKLEKAAQLLRNSDAAIASICYDVGFSDTSNFSKTFSAYFKCTPSKFRQENS